VKLYELTNQTRELQSMADCGDLSQEDIQQTLDGLEAQFAEKVEAALKVRQSMLAEVSAIDNEIGRLEALKSSPAKNSDRLLDYIKENMSALEMDKLDAGLFKVTLKKASIKLGDIDESKLSENYFNIIPETKKLDKRLLLSDAKNKSIDGVELVESARSLIIK
tara:strand:+ start:41 stop:532 length:492 start_codon:yes stop_codon:yes gene_type:complete